MKTDKDVIHERLISVDVPTEASLSKKELSEEYSFYPYVQPLVNTVDYPDIRPEPHDYSKDYFTFEILTGGNITWSYYDDDEGDYTDATKTIYYSKNNGEWTEMPRSLSVVAGDVIRFKGDNSGYSDDEYNYNSFKTSTAVFNVKGNIMSLINSSNFTSLTALTTEFTFHGLMMNCHVIDASNLILPATILNTKCYASMFTDCRSLTQAPELPATTLANYCYGSMFFNCTSLVSAPELPARTLAPDCYESMFYSCTSLNYIKCLATDINAYVYTNEWVNDVSSTGTFVTPSSTQWTTGINGIPTGWTRINA